MISAISWVLTSIKILLIPSYRSTDFEVHRNWLAITHSLPKEKWYYDTTSEWTLDYPPFFAWFEYALSQVAFYFDPRMLQVQNLNYASPETVLFQRLSVIIADLILACGISKCCQFMKDSNSRQILFLIIFGNAGLLMVDHIHFQYNGLLFGIMLLSLGDALTESYLASAFWFTVLLNMKHIYLYVAPAYVIHLLRSYCFTVSSKDGFNVAWYSFSIRNLLKLALVVIAVTMASFGPFLDHMPQILSRLFPFKRGLSHAYWAPNFWALYNITDKVLVMVLPKLGFNVASVKGLMTGGLVQEQRHLILPTIAPFHSFFITVTTMIPCLYKLWVLGADKRRRSLHFIRALVLCASCSFMFGWHVHEKAILILIIPLSILAIIDRADGKHFLVLTTVGHYSLFPLLYPRNLTCIKLLILLVHSGLCFYSLPSLYNKTSQLANQKYSVLTVINSLELIYVLGFIPLFIYDNFIHSVMGFDKTLPFFPLMITSIYCAIGVLYFFTSYYKYFMSLKITYSNNKRN